MKVNERRTGPTHLSARILESLLASCLALALLSTSILSQLSLHSTTISIAVTMKLAVAAVMAFVASSVQLRPSVSHTGGIQISDYFKNHTFPATGFNAVQDVTTLAHELPPALPQHPVLRVFGESFLPLGPSAHDDAWERVKCKGANFVRAMRGSDREAGTLFSPPLDSAASQFDVGCMYADLRIPGLHTNTQ